MRLGHHVSDAARRLDEAGYECLRAQRDLACGSKGTNLPGVPRSLPGRRKESIILLATTARSHEFNCRTWVVHKDPILVVADLGELLVGNKYLRSGSTQSEARTDPRYRGNTDSPWTRKSPGVSFRPHLWRRGHMPFDGWGRIPRVADVEVFILIFPSPRESPPRESDATRSALRSPRAHRDRRCRRGR